MNETVVQQDLVQIWYTQKIIYYFILPLNRNFKILWAFLVKIPIKYLIFGREEGIRTLESVTFTRFPITDIAKLPQIL